MNVNKPVALVLLAIFSAMVWACCLRSDDIEQIREAYDPFLGHELLNVPDDEKIPCMEWACGEDFESAKWNTLSDRWRSLHPDLPIVHDCDTWERFFKVVAEQWRIKQNWSALASKVDK